MKDLEEENRILRRELSLHRQLRDLEQKYQMSRNSNASLKRKINGDVVPTDIIEDMLDLSEAELGKYLLDEDSSVRRIARKILKSRDKIYE